MIASDCNWTASDLDLASIAYLYNLMDEGCPQIAAHARGLLVEGEYYKYLETIVRPDMSKSLKPLARPSDQLKDKSKMENFRLFPNPANDYVIVYFDLSSEDNNSYIYIYDMRGNLIKSFAIDEAENQVVIDLIGISNGIYLVTLLSNGKIVDSKKLSRVKD